jgi:hypothetical protein
MKQIPLYGKYGKGKFTLVDEGDYEYLNRFRWRVSKQGYVVRQEYLGVVKGKEKYISYRMHREVMGVTDPNIFVDHKFHNKLDNRKEMLRICSNSQNQMNKKPKRGTTSKYKGVTWANRNKRWQVYVNHKYIGQFKSEKEAALAYNEKAKELFGEFAFLNKVGGE